MVLNSWASSWVMTYAFNFMLEWSPAGESSSLPLPPTAKHTDIEDFFNYYSEFDIILQEHFSSSVECVLLLFYSYGSWCQRKRDEHWKKYKLQ